MVGFYKHKTSAEAAWKYVLICSVGLAFALYGTILTYSNAFSVVQDAHKAMLWTELIKMAHQLDSQMMKLAFVFILIGFGTKAGLVPMHTWLPDAHSEAPSPASALLSGVLLKCALFAMVRYYAIALQSVGSEFPQTLLLIFGLLSVGVAAFFILVQNDIKRKLAYSSVEHIGIIATGLGVGGPLGIFAAFLHTINHSITKSLLFCTTGNITMKYGTRDATKIRGMKKVAPLTGFLFAAGLIAVAGSPPFNIFISELMTLTAGLKSGLFWPMILLLLFLVIAFAALVILISETVLGSPPEDLPGVRPTGWVYCLWGSCLSSWLGWGSIYRLRSTNCCRMRSVLSWGISGIAIKWVINEGFGRCEFDGLVCAGKHPASNIG